MFSPHVVVAPRPDLPQRVPDDRSSGKVVVVGGGLAGVTAATVLAERGLTVELLEAAPRLGGRLGTWPRTLPDGTDVTVEHGYHGFFRQYYTLRDVLRRIDPDLAFLRDVGGYPVESREWESEDFSDLPTTPLANLAALVWKSPSFRLRDLRKVDGREALAMLRYDPVRTFAEHDHRTTAELLDSFGFSERGRAMLFEVFAHSFFNTEQRYSAAEFLAMCHFYFTGNPEGLGMDVPVDQYAATIWDPFARLLDKHGATVTTGARATMVVDGPGGWSVGVEGGASRTARHLVVATDVPATRELFARSPAFATTGPRLAAQVADLPGGEPYVVARLWCRGDVDAAHAPFTGVTRERILDSVTLFHRIEAESAAWAARTGGSVIELHSYACPHSATRDELVAEMRRELAGLWPEFAGLEVLDVDAHLYDNAPGFDPGFHVRRPGVVTDARGLRLAGDWVATDIPSALMERAAVTGVLAANDVLREEGVAPEPIRSIAPRGVLAGRRR
ncbi:FAD-dependent oxidoreductase [Actinomycetospora termitidis]|uniref:FAD-dependent oxidoreductase n=1 Tax=Actinomycetospora termitidis TaxID=3053470 RepID=A0ABT7MDN8_9PSEU|nr:FAD-dependent oxidoreductase [Actinomycetospora sp. Odt1-22]MDL5158097.1 FAD-dependent oxidoreductase [Actinomycetospora sp. Odt1-22]